MSVITDKVISSLSIRSFVNACVLAFLGRNHRANRTVQHVRNNIFLVWLFRLRRRGALLLFGGRGLLLLLLLFAGTVGLAGVVSQWPRAEDSSCTAELTTETATPLEKGILSQRRQEYRAIPHFVLSTGSNPSLAALCTVSPDNYRLSSSRTSDSWSRDLHFTFPWFPPCPSCGTTI